jgi:biopolymer transport protein ExbD
MQFSDRTSAPSGLNITPLIDVVLLLLIFFMISSSFVVQPGIKVDLPESDSGSVPSKNEVRIVLGADGALFFEGKPIDLASLQTRLAALQNSLDKKDVAVIQADKKAPHGEVVAVMDAVQRAGLRIAIGTNPRPGEQP